MRLYHDFSQSDPLLKKLLELQDQDANLDLCDATNLPGTPLVDARHFFPMIWRFFPAIDPQVSLGASLENCAIQIS